MQSVKIDSLNNDPNSRQASLREWYASFLGQSMLAEMRKALAAMLAKTYGYHALQLGGLMEAENFLADSELIHPLLMDMPAAGGNVFAEATRLPLRSKSLDLILLPHTLDISLDPYQTLREVDRVLVDDGHVIVIGFNPYSLWGGLRLLLKWRECLPWNAHFYPLHRVEDWLGLLGFRVLARDSLFFLPPINHPASLQKLRYLQYMHAVVPHWGAVYILKARKHTVPLTGQRHLWLPKRRVVSGGNLVRPTQGRLEP